MTDNEARVKEIEARCRVFRANGVAGPFMDVSLYLEDVEALIEQLRADKLWGLQAENERLRKDWREEFEMCWREYALAPDSELSPDAIEFKNELLKIAGVQSAREEGRKEAALEAFKIAWKIQKDYSFNADNAQDRSECRLWNGLAAGAMKVKQAISKHFGLDAAPRDTKEVADGK